MTMPFTCSICEEESTRICVRCTKDACNNHLCERCHRCSDCCECEVVLSDTMREPVRSMIHKAEPEPHAPAHAPEPEIEPEFPSEDEF